MINPKVAAFVVETHTLRWCAENTFNSRKIISTYVRNFDEKFLRKRASIPITEFVIRFHIDGPAVVQIVTQPEEVTLMSPLAVPDFVLSREYST